MANESHPRSGNLAAKDYFALGFSALALIVSGAGFYFQFIAESYKLYAGISDVRISLTSLLRPSATFLFSNSGNQRAVILRLSADIYPASESCSADNCKLPQIRQVVSLQWVNLSSANGTVKASPILLKPNDIVAYRVDFSELSDNDRARAVASGHGNQFLLVCWSASYYSKQGFIMIRHFAATVSRFDDLNDLQEQRTPTSLISLPQ